jgi:hypothetical protein
MKHLFVPYELAVMAQDKGAEFPDRLASYNADGSFAFSKSQETEDVNWTEAPLYQQLVDWFREHKDIHIVYSPHFKTNGQVAGWIFDTYVQSNALGRKESSKTIEGSNYYEAYNTALIEALKLI